VRAQEFGCRPLNGPSRLEPVGIARNAVVVGLAAVRIGVDRHIADGGVHQHAAFKPVVRRSSQPRVSRNSGTAPLLSLRGGAFMGSAA